MSTERSAERPSLSIIIPTFNEARSIRAMIEQVALVRGRNEIIVVDGGSTDETVEIARDLGAQVIKSERGRGLQMQRGACAAQGERYGSTRGYNAFT